MDYGEYSQEFGHPILGGADFLPLHYLGMFYLSCGVGGDDPPLMEKGKEALGCLEVALKGGGGYTFFSAGGDVALYGYGGNGRRHIGK